MLIRGLVIKLFRQNTINKLFYPFSFKHTHTNQFKQSRNNYTQPCFYFSDQGQKKPSVINQIDEIYKKQGFTNTFVKKYQRKVVQYQQIMDWKSIQLIYEFVLQKAKQQIGVDNDFYVKAFYMSIYSAGMINPESLFEKSKILYGLLLKNPTNIFLDDSPLENQIAHALIKRGYILEAIKWLGLFKLKYTDFDNTDKITDKTRIIIYKSFYECYNRFQSKKQSLYYSKKTYNLIQKGESGLSKKSELYSIFNYGIAEFILGQKQKGLNALKIFQQSIDWNDPDYISLVLNLSSAYQVGGQKQRSETLYQKFLKHFQSQKNTEIYQNQMRQILVTLIQLQIRLEKYQTIQQRVKQMNMLNYFASDTMTVIHYLLNVLCCYKLDKIENIDSSLRNDALFLSKQINLITELKLLMGYLEQIEKKIKVEITTKQKQTFKEMKSIFNKKIQAGNLFKV